MPKAMILAAGLGTRLQPITYELPKALVPLAGKPLIFYVLQRLKQFQYKDIIVNLHHHGDMIKTFLSQNRFNNFNISFSVEFNQLLDTGGGIRKANWFFNDGNPFIVHNCDVISLLPLDDMMRFHLSNKALATLAVSSRASSRPLAFDENNRLLGRKNLLSHTDSNTLAFSGIYILDPKIFSYMPGEGTFSIIDILITASKEAMVIAFEHDPEIWVDAGSIKNFGKAERLLKNTHF